MDTKSLFTPLSEIFLTISGNEKKNTAIPKKIITSGFRYVTLAKDKTLTAAAHALNRIAPNFVYCENVFIAYKKSWLNVFEYGKNAGEESQKLFKDGISLQEGFALKTAPAIRVNYSRLLVSLVRTLKRIGCEVELPTNSVPEINSHPTIFLEGTQKDSPIRHTLFIPLENSGIWLINRGESFYIIGENICDGQSAADAINHTLLNSHIKPKNLKSHTLLNLSALNEPLKAMSKIIKAINLENIMLDSTDFNFSPSAPDVIGYADMKFDEVKRMDINVNTFKNAVFDFGTHIDHIIERTYDLYPQYRKGQLAFDAAIKEWEENELN